MATLLTQKARAETLNRELLVKAIFEFIRSIETELVALNREQIVKDSTGIMGDALGFYSKATEFITTNDALLGKNVRIKRAGDPFDLLQHGHFQDGFYAKVVDNIVHFGSTDPKTDDILALPTLLTKDIFGLTDANLHKVIQQFILPFYLQHSRKQLGL